MGFPGPRKGYSFFSSEAEIMFWVVSAKIAVSTSGVRLGGEGVRARELGRGMRKTYGRDKWALQRIRSF
jgi:hypothetical protein